MSGWIVANPHATHQRDRPAARHTIKSVPGRARTRDEVLRIETREAALRRIQQRIQAKVPRDVSLADELIDDRRREDAPHPAIPYNRRP
ncbi:MAG: AbrB family transcriptional regulator [Acidobacteria bacterium]|nr:AbrB family transcriptional regulator [Acidobacteriota bacterium]